MGHTVEYATAHRTQLIRDRIGWYWDCCCSPPASTTTATISTPSGRMPCATPMRVERTARSASSQRFLRHVPDRRGKRQSRREGLEGTRRQVPGHGRRLHRLFYLGTMYVDKGKLADAEKSLQAGGRRRLQALRLASQALAGPDSTPPAASTADAEKLLRDLLNNPTMMVSKDQATITLASVLMQVQSGRGPQTPRAVADRAGRRRAHRHHRARPNRHGSLTAPCRPPPSGT